MFLAEFHDLELQKHPKLQSEMERKIFKQQLLRTSKSIERMEEEKKLCSTYFAVVLTFSRQEKT